MARFNKIVFALLTGLMVSGLVMTAGCKKQEGAGGGTTAGETTVKLEEVHTAVIEAEKKLSGLRNERARLEKELKEKKNGAR
jgi:hypothetical protein